MSEFTSPTVQKMNLIRYIGDQVSKSRKPISRFPKISTEIGISSEEFLEQLFEELCERGIIKMTKSNEWPSDATRFANVNLTLDGWEQYEGGTHDELEGNYGFLAMQFNVPDLDSFVEEVVKPTVNDMGYNLVDMNKKRAGIIDNIMRTRIRDAKFVIADLTHDNNGAYWEAGYAEGLGKPVIYICEKEKFESVDGTHFDTNHCTTVIWSRDDDEAFRKDLTETISESLDES